jgi:hypothetical protein
MLCANPLIKRGLMSLAQLVDIYIIMQGIGIRTVVIPFIHLKGETSFIKKKRWNFKPLDYLIKKKYEAILISCNTTLMLNWYKKNFFSILHVRSLARVNLITILAILNRITGQIRPNI